MRLDDKTHGDGANRKGRTERTFRAGKWDTGVCIGQKSHNQTMSLMGGSNGLGGAMPAFVVIASHYEPTIEMLEAGPVVYVNGIKLGTTGTANPKGSVTGEEAIMFLEYCIVPWLAAYGETTHPPCHSTASVAIAHTVAANPIPIASTAVVASCPAQVQCSTVLLAVVLVRVCAGVLRPDRKAVGTCDGAGPHMTTAFIERCHVLHIELTLRTPNCSNTIQFEDLVNFWQLKNDSSFGWYKVKQQAILVQMDKTRGRSVALSHHDQLELLVKPWSKGFSTETNLRAWTKVIWQLEL